MPRALDASGPVRSGDLELWPSQGLVLAAGKPIVVSRLEGALLEILMRNDGRVVSRDDLYLGAWGQELRSGDRSVDVYVHKLRAKLESVLPDHRFIHTHPSFGYRLAQEPLRLGSGAHERG